MAPLTFTDLLCMQSIMAKAKHKRGGYRPGAGRKLIGDEPRVRINITLPHSHRQRAKQLGQGNVSLGISRALETCPDWSHKEG